MLLTMPNQLTLYPLPLWGVQWESMVPMKCKWCWLSAAWWHRWTPTVWMARISFGWHQGGCAKQVRTVKMGNKCR